MKLEVFNASSPQGIQDLGPAFKKNRVDAITLITSQLFAGYRTQLIAMAIAARIPTIYWTGAFVTSGGLMSYGVNVPEHYRRAAFYVDKILKGTKPADLPVEQPAKFELMINLKTAKQIGRTIPPNVLTRADRVIR
jgi:putative ABC transport system substrate-binding protein